MAPVHVAVGRGAEDAVEPAEEGAQRAACLLPRPQQQRGQGWAERQRVERRDDHRHGDGDGELLVELAGDAGNEGGGHEHRGQDQGDGDHRPGDLVHRLEGRVARRQPVLDVVLDRLDDDDGVVDDDADRQHQAEQRQRVDREPEQREDGEGADQRHRHREQRNERGTRKPWRKMKTTMMTRTRASNSVLMISLMPSLTASVVSSETT